MLRSSFVTSFLVDHSFLLTFSFIPPAWARSVRGLFDFISGSGLAIGELEEAEVVVCLPVRPADGLVLLVAVSVARFY